MLIVCAGCVVVHGWKGKFGLWDEYSADGGKVVMENDANDDGAVDENMSQKEKEK